MNTDAPNSALTAAVRVSGTLVLLTACAMLAFAANSLLARLALRTTLWRHPLSRLALRKLQAPRDWSQAARAPELVYTRS